MKDILKFIISISAFIWAVYPVEVGESDEVIEEYLNFDDSDSSSNWTIQDTTYTLHVIDGMKGNVLFV